MPTAWHLESLMNFLDVLFEHRSLKGDGWIRESAVLSHCLTNGKPFLFDPGLPLARFIEDLEKEGVIAVTRDTFTHLQVTARIDEARSRLQKKMEAPLAVSVS